MNIMDGRQSQSKNIIKYKLLQKKELDKINFSKKKMQFQKVFCNENFYFVYYCRKYSVKFKKLWLKIKKQ